MDVRLLIWGAFGGIGFAFFLTLMILLRKFHNKAANNMSSNSSSRKKFLVASKGIEDDNTVEGMQMLLRDFTYEQLHNATHGFSADNLLTSNNNNQQEEGLYRGVLDGGECIVIKCFGTKDADDDHYDEQAAEAELEIMCSMLSHRRVAPLIGVCTTLHERGGLHRMLVFKQMPNGDLASALGIRRLPPASCTSSDDSLLSGGASSDESSTSDRSSSTSTCTSGGSKPLDWITRFKIAIGVAEALVFLHHECSPAIIHSNLKSSCVLLDQGYEVRLGGMGKAVRSEGMYPVYDIYCFGKILLDLISGLDVSSGVDALGKAWLDKAMPHLMKFKLSNDAFLALVDPALVVDEDHVKELMLLASIARSCLDPQQAQYQTMVSILGKLQNPDSTTTATTTM